MSTDLVVSILKIVFLTVFFYFYVKKLIFKLSLKVATILSLAKYYPLGKVVGMVELIFISTLHFILSVSGIFLFKSNIYIFSNKIINDILFGVLIGLGCLGTSILLSVSMMKLIEMICVDHVFSTEEWRVLSRGGWMRHHYHTIKILPYVISLAIVFLQICAEEIIFRGIFMNYLLVYGIKYAFIIPLILFVYMQTLHMPNKICSMFPVIGAIIMGFVHGILYLFKPYLFPLVISHFTFFLFALL